MSEPDTNPDYPYDPSKVWPQAREFWFPGSELQVEYKAPEVIGVILGPKGETLKVLMDKEFRGYRKD